MAVLRIYVRPRLAFISTFYRNSPLMNFIAENFNWCLNLRSASVRQGTIIVPCRILYYFFKVKPNWRIYWIIMSTYVQCTYYFSLWSSYNSLIFVTIVHIPFNVIICIFIVYYKPCKSCNVVRRGLERHATLYEYGESRLSLYLNMHELLTY